MIRIDLNLLAVFDAVMTERHVTRAAKRLAMSQPAVSNALGRLRFMLKDELFLKIPTGVEPTPRAIELWGSVRAALAQIREALDPAAFDPATARSKFTIAMTDYTSALFLPSLMERLELKAPGIDLRVVPNTNINASTLLDRGEIDFGFGVYPEQGSRFRTQVLFREEYVCAMRRDHPLTRQTLTPEAFASAKHLLISLTGDATGFIDRALEEIGMKRRIALTVNQFALAPVIVVKSDLIATLTRRAIRRSGLENKLHLAPLPIALAPTLVRLIWHERNERDPSHKWLRQEIAEIAAAV